MMSVQSIYRPDDMLLTAMTLQCKPLSGELTGTYNRKTHGGVMSSDNGSPKSTTTYL